jgi:signal transduction histidine kinase
MARLREQLPDAEGDTQEQARQLHDAVIALAHDIQAISHRLHSSKIDLLGLSAAAASFCREASTRHNLSIEYAHENVPSQLADGVAISLFRVLQEAVSNAVKHSGAERCKVKLHASNGTLTLEVADDGRGFETVAALKGHGLGLMSMQERLKLVNGEVAIRSKAGVGTTIRATVPLITHDAVQPQAS